MPNPPMRFFTALAPIGALALVSVTARLFSVYGGSSPESSAAAIDGNLSRFTIRSQTADPRTQKALESVVAGQLAALRKNDIKAALQYNVTADRDQADPDQFARMLRHRYPHIAAPRNASYRTARYSRFTASMRVLVTGRDGTNAIYIYNFRRDPTNWRVQSVIPTFPRNPFPHDR